MLSKIKAYFFIAIAFIATILAVTFRFQLLKNQAKKAEEKAKKALTEAQLNRRIFKSFHELEKVQQADMQRVLKESKRDYFARKQSKNKKNKGGKQ